MIRVHLVSAVCLMSVLSSAQTVTESHALSLNRACRADIAEVSCEQTIAGNASQHSKTDLNSRETLVTSVVPNVPNQVPRSDSSNAAIVWSHTSASWSAPIDSVSQLTHLSSEAVSIDASGYLIPYTAPQLLPINTDRFWSPRIPAGFDTTPLKPNLPLTKHPRNHSPSRRDLVDPEARAVKLGSEFNREWLLLNAALDTYQGYGTPQLLEWADSIVGMLLRLAPTDVIKGTVKEQFLAYATCRVEFPTALFRNLNKVFMTATSPLTKEQLIERLWDFSENSNEV